MGRLHLFPVAIELLESGIKLAGAGAAEGLFDGVSNPFAGLAASILATVLAPVDPLGSWDEDDGDAS